MSPTRPPRVLAALALTAAVALLAAACGGSSDDHVDADVAFATDMVPHHAQALEMADLAEGRPLDPEVEQLVTDIRDAQAPEIETMTGWLEEWDEDVPATDGDMAGMDDGESSGSAMPGMMSADDMAALEAASDEQFQQQWLEMMVEHHEGAVEMARTEIDEGRYQPAVDLARDIVNSQSAEIDTMQRLLG